MKLKPFMALLVMSAAVSGAWADDSSNITISGFGTAALTRTNTSDAEFARPNQLAGVTTDAKTGVDSNFGIQVTAKANDWLSFTGQGLVRKNVTDNFGAELAWAFAKAKVNDNLSLRLGRVGLPVYMISDYRNVGYANTMLRPPVEMYTQVILESVDGIDGIYQTAVGETNITAQLSYGVTDSDSRSSYTAKFKKLSSLNVVLENGPLTLRFGRVDTNVTVDNSANLNLLVGGLRKYGYNAAADSIAVQDTKASFTSVGLGLDYKNIVIQAEYGKRKSATLAIPDTSSWYTMFGYRMGAFLPYVVHASAKQDSPRTVAGTPTAGPLLAYTYGANALASASPIQTSNSLGVRWDFHKSAALKLQFDRMSPENGPGTFINAKPNFAGSVNVFAAAVDFVF
ncbi:porin family protein [Undibacterium oligocarboniphilum]|uniref:Porin n=1 Tax=Undibacterium oligocarboniphilum TaxID=666702 RepID=A0A850QBV8_9BURK|nr:hypothetical protein [Undibacterium oligocarboniphilum]MBC3869493.1 hypothetical protein [Undibacterium oligocarboniphilum]NVO77872.1 hypothetical protein [Undibacterium oligocarboniphilum]